MANDPTIFVFAEKEVRTVTVEGEAVWTAKDVAEALGYVWKGSASVKHVPAEWRGVTSVQTPSGEQEMTFLTEAGLFFFLNRSDKPAALPFQKWVAGEVLPAIRKSGGYMVAAPDETEEELAARALRVMQATVARQKAQLAVAQPKADAMDLMEAATSKPMGVRDAGRHLQIGQNEVVRLALDWGWACRESRKLKSTHYGREREYTVMTPRTYVREGEDFVDLEFKLTRKGVDRMAIKIAKAKASRPRMEPRMSDTIGFVRH